MKRYPIEMRAAALLLLFGWLNAEAGELRPLADVYDARMEGRQILTPPAPASPRINAPAVYGARPGRPIIFRLPTTGRRPIAFHAEGLPASVMLDAGQGILTGRAPAERGEYRVLFTARNLEGEDQAEWTLVVGDQLALTPPMGWNHWYTHYHFITDAKIRAAADAMVSSGMADAGYQYVSIDDCWMRIDPAHVRESTDAKRKTASTGLDVAMKSGTTRDGEGRFIPAGDFPDMKALTDYVHRHGLKAGIYSSPGPRTCQSFEGSYTHEELDARTFSEWGFDLLKYDWCTYNEVFTALPDDKKNKDARKQPYYLMGQILARQDRDIVHNLCQYGMANVWEWGAQVGQSWRVGGDLGHTLTKGGIYAIAERTLGIRQYNRPGAWNDPDYLILGRWTTPFDKAAPLAPVQLTPEEQYSYMSLWCLMASPLFFSGDMGEIDDFTRNLLCNPEMIAVNQDRLGECAEVVRMDMKAWILRKRMADGSVVAGFFDLANHGDQEIGIDWRRLKIEGERVVRDLWRQQDVGLAGDNLAVKVGPRGCAVFQLRSLDQRDSRSLRVRQ